MPIYEYRRPDGSTFDVLQKFSDEALTVDPETGVPVERVLHAPAIHFKGKGFHNTDYGTRRRNRELERSAESGANDHDDKMKEKKDKETKSDSSSSDSSSAKSESVTAKPGSGSSDKPKPTSDKKAKKAA